MRKSGGNISPVSGLPSRQLGEARDQAGAKAQVSFHPCVLAQEAREELLLLSLFSPPAWFCPHTFPLFPEQPPSVTPGIQGGFCNEPPSQETDPGKPEPKEEAGKFFWKQAPGRAGGSQGPSPPECVGPPEGWAWFSRLKPSLPSSLALPWGRGTVEGESEPPSEKQNLQESCRPPL